MMRRQFSRAQEAAHRHPLDAEWVFTMASGIPYKSVRGFNAVCKAANLQDVTSAIVSAYFC
jgi:hypothetical protein